MTQIYQEIVNAKKKNEKLLAILLDPEKLKIADIQALCLKINRTKATHILVGGSTFNGNYLDELLIETKKHSKLPILLFPGDYKQISDEADGILLLSLLSGRNPDYLIEHQINAVPLLRKTKLEIIPTAYLLIESGSQTAVERVSLTKPMDRSDNEYVAQTAKAGEFMGNKLVYLEAGSGAKIAVSLEMIKVVSTTVQVPLIVGGGIRTKEAIEKTFQAGADMIVIGTAFETNNSFFDL